MGKSNKKKRERKKEIVEQNEEQQSKIFGGYKIASLSVLQLVFFGMKCLYCF